MKIIGSPRLPRESYVADQGEEDKYDNGTCFCISNGMKFLMFPVFDTEIEEMKQQSMIPFHKKRSPPYNAELDYFRSTQLTYGTSFVSVGSMLYCFGGDKSTGCEYGTEVKMFDTKISEFVQVDQRPPPLNEARSFPAVVAIGKIIYVFDGLNPKSTQPSSWAECLNTDMPIAMQKWMPLKQPPFTLKLTSFSFAIPYGKDSILIADTEISEGALLYNVRDGIWIEYQPSFSRVLRAPVSVACENTIYWICGLCIRAYDYDKQLHYSGILREILYVKDFINTSPYLMHLKDDIFCCFTLYDVYDRGLSRTGVVQCTTFQVTKISPGKLHLRAMGYKSYKCGTVFFLHGAVSIRTRICLSKITKPRCAKKKKSLKEKEMAQSHPTVPPWE